MALADFLAELDQLAAAGNQAFEQAADELREKHQGTSAEKPFRAGYERGQAYLRVLSMQQTKAHGAMS